MPLRLFQRRRHQDGAHALYVALVQHARTPDFYETGGVPDTVDGRFDMIALHVFLLLHRLKSDDGSEAARDLAQNVFDLMFADMDRNLREMGVGDLSVGKRVKAMVAAFYGRITAYETGLADDDAVLAAALGRNLFRGVEPAQAQTDAMVAYVRRQSDVLAAQPLDSLRAGRIEFHQPEAA